MPWLDSLKNVKDLDSTKLQRILNIEILGFEITSKSMEF